MVSASSATKAPARKKKKSLCGKFRAQLDDLVAAGKFTPIRDWLREKIHNVGSLYPSADELCEAVTSAPLDPGIYVEHLNKKYSALYGVAE